ncbi:hypothetical protein [Catenulispora pinisilvae]|uniref:hypothetical protein n=1 Tax=Catenulispora pinisilvae TaxID=2705253 RepID=UPI001E5ED6AE|nr:hypothetical protein [Catenulispora pinisilvae]
MPAPTTPTTSTTLVELFEERTGGSIGQLGGFGNPHSDDDFRRVLYFHRHGHPNAQWCDHFHSREEYLASVTPAQRADPRRHGEEFDWIFDTADAIASEAARWRLLLRIDSNHAMRLNLMDWDPIYFYAPADEIESGRIEHVEAMVTQG